MANYWVSWYHNHYAMGEFEMARPWWATGYAGEFVTVVAAVKANTEDEAKKAIINAYDDPPRFLTWRFAEKRPDDWEPFCDRFQRASWMEW